MPVHKMSLEERLRRQKKATISLLLLMLVGVALTFPYLVGCYGN